MSSCGYAIKVVNDTKLCYNCSESELINEDHTCVNYSQCTLFIRNDQCTSQCPHYYKKENNQRFCIEDEECHFVLEEDILQCVDIDNCKYYSVSNNTKIC